VPHLFYRMAIISDLQMGRVLIDPIRLRVVKN
jgi:hypothetical protein